MRVKTTTVISLLFGIKTNHHTITKGNKAMEKFIYIIDYIPPYTEYGGVIEVIAKDEEEVMSLLRERFEDDFAKEHFNIVEKFRLADPMPSRIVTSFTT